MKTKPRHGGVGLLTKRQAEVMRFHTLGYTQEDISKALGISQPRVSAALRAAKEKISLAKATLEFYEEISYISELRRAGYKGEIVLAKPAQSIGNLPEDNL
jgi:transcriptional regulator